MSTCYILRHSVRLVNAVAVYSALERCYKFWNFFQIAVTYQGLASLFCTVFEIRTHQLAHRLLVKILCTLVALKKHDRLVIDT